MRANHPSAPLFKRLRYALEAAAFRFCTCIISRLPYRAILILAKAGGFCAYHLATRPRRIALANLDVAFGNTKSPTEKKEIARRSMQNFATTMLSLMWTKRRALEKLNQVVEIAAEDLARAREVLSRGRGVVCVTLHYGNWELLALAAGAQGFPLHIVTETLRNRSLENQVTQLRSSTGNRIVPQQGAVKKLLRVLRKGEAVALIIDQNPPEEGGGEWLEFFGLPAFSNVAAAALALRTGAPVFACHAVPLPNGRIKIAYGPEIPYTPTGNNDTDQKRLSQQCLRHFEELIRQRPELWLWCYKRWKHRRDADDSRYPFYTSPAVLTLPRRPVHQTNTAHNNSVASNTQPYL
ncbi:MAG: hypothetical protein N3B01_10580 [Verrucomicrobiae bacterium]|nr:hypothetical protein [Verrucomicrobiae bacterium]